MNIKTLLLSSTLAITSLFGGVAEARPNHFVDYTGDDGTYISIKPVGRYGVNVLVDNEFRKTGFIGNMDCSNGEYQWRANTGFSESRIRGILNKACNF